MILIENAEDYVDFKQNLYSFAKNESVEYKLKHEKIINSKKEIIGLTMSKMRELAKEICKGEPKKYLEFAKNDTYEEAMIYGLVISGLKDNDLKMQKLKKWVKVIDTWSLCDSVCISLKSLAKSKDTDKYFEEFYKMSFSNVEFISRFGIVAILVCFLDEKYMDKILYMCENVKNEAYYVQMAIAWLVCEICIKFKSYGFKLLEKQTLLVFTQNKAISKCHDSYRLTSEEKEYLKKYRKTSK